MLMFIIFRLLTLHSDYDIFLSPLEEFKEAVKEAGLENKVVYLDRKDAYHFRVKDGQ